MWTVNVIALLALSAAAQDNYSFLTFNVEWPITNCMEMTCPAGYEYSDFNIHGLWPSYPSGGSGPFYCESTPYSNTAALEAEMNEHWRSYTGDNVPFWTHEWTKHGTCYATGETPEEFFTTVLNLMAK